MLAGLLVARGHCGGRGAAGTGTGRGPGSGTEPPQHHDILQNILSKPVAGCSPPRALSIYCDGLAFITSGAESRRANFPSAARGGRGARAGLRAGRHRCPRPPGWVLCRNNRGRARPEFQTRPGDSQEGVWDLGNAQGKAPVFSLPSPHCHHRAQRVRPTGLQLLAEQFLGCLRAPCHAGGSARVVAVVLGAWGHQAVGLGCSKGQEGRAEGRVPRDSPSSFPVTPRGEEWGGGDSLSYQWSCLDGNKICTERHENGVNKRDKNGTIKPATSPPLIKKRERGEERGCAEPLKRQLLRQPQP